MILNQKCSYPYCAFPLWYLEHSRDMTLLTDNEKLICYVLDSKVAISLE